MSTQTLKLTDSQIALLRALVKEKCNIALYRNGQARLRDSAHNPLRNLKTGDFESVKDFLKKDSSGLFVFNPDKQNVLPNLR